MDFDLKLMTIALAIAFSTLVGLVLWYWKKRRPCENKEAERLLQEYLQETLDSKEIGTFYERYIGHLYELKNYHVNYHGALNGFDDLGRDLIITGKREIIIVQTKCWAKFKVISEKHIYQLYGSMVHYQRTHPCGEKTVKARFYTTANFSSTAKEAARALDVELKTQELNRNYPLIKCNTNHRGQKIYHLPFDPFYDKIRIDISEDKFYVHTVKEAVARGFRRARQKKEDAA